MNIRVFIVSLVFTSSLFLSPINTHAQSLEALQTLILKLQAYVAELTLQVAKLKNTSQTALISGAGSGLVAHYTFDERSGTTAGDSIGGATGTLMNGPVWTAGKVGGGALSFDGVNDYVKINSFVSSPNTSVVTISAWIKPESTCSGCGIVTRDNNTTAGRWIFSFTTGNLVSFAKANTAVVARSSSGNSVSVNKWQHVVAVWDGSNSSVGIKFYIDGNETSSYTNALEGLGAISDTGLALNIGSRGAGFQPFKGSIDDVRIYNRALSNSEIIDIYNLSSVPNAVNLPSNVIDGQCGSLVNTCSAGSLQDVTDSTLQNLWICNGVSGGLNSSCSYTIPVVTVDSTAPVISNIQVSTISQDSAVINFVTNEQSSLVVEYGTTLNFGTYVNDNQLNLSHSTLMSNLEPSTLYYFRIKSKDATGNESLSQVGNFTTLSLQTTEIGTDLGLIKNSQKIDWSKAGVPGGIQERTAICSTIDATVYGDGMTDATAVIQAAVNSCPAGKVVFLPAGRYVVSKPIDLGYKKNVTLRGSGKNTVIDARGASAYVFNIGGGGSYGWNSPNVSVLQSPKKGESVLYVGDTSFLNSYSNGGIGVLGKINLLNDLNLPVFSVGGYERQRKQMFRIIGKTSNTITIYPELYFDLPENLSPKINLASQHAEYVGIEDLNIEMKNSSAIYGIYLQQTYGSWIKNVNLSQSKNYGIFVSDSLGCEMRHSSISERQNWPNLSSNGAGILTGSITACLFEDNIVTKQFPTVEVNFGSTGNVFAYNFFADTQVDSNHAPHNSYNLYEGNIAPNLQSDGYFGSASDDMLFRNWFHGTKEGSSVVSWTVSLNRFTRNYSFIGNIFGRTGYTLPNGFVDGNSFGNPNMGNGAYSGTAQPSVGDWWDDFNTKGKLKNRIDKDTAIVTLESGKLSLAQWPIAFTWQGGARYNMTVTAINGLDITLDSLVNPAGNDLPVEGTDFRFFTGPGGFQELDLDVKATTIRKANWSAGINGIPADQIVNQVLPNSLYLTSKPDWFCNLAWPPFDPISPNQDFSAIPAGYRYVHKKELECTASNGSSITPTNALCSTTLNQCVVGSFVDSADSSTAYLWQCLGANGGTNASCSLLKPASSPAPVPPTQPPSSGGGGGGTYIPPVAPTPTPPVSGGGGAIPVSSPSATVTPPSSPVPQPQGAATILPPLTSPLYKGLEHTEVRALQTFLYTEGYLPKDAIIGYFGSKTEKAVQEFQRKNNIVTGGSAKETGYGLVGGKTRSVINTIIQTKYSSGGTSPATIILTEEQKIVALQKQLSELQALVATLMAQLAEVLKKRGM